MHDSCRERVPTRNHAEMSIYDVFPACGGLLMNEIENRLILKDSHAAVEYRGLQVIGFGN